MKEQRTRLDDGEHDYECLVKWKSRRGEMRWTPKETARSLESGGTTRDKDKHPMNVAC
jgi:hypothetical protein